MQNIINSINLFFKIATDWKEEARKNKEIKEKNNFSSYVLRLKQHLPNIKMGDKKLLTSKEMAKLLASTSNEETTKYKIQLDDISSARASGDVMRITQAIKNLSIKLNDVVEQSNEIKELIKNYEFVTKFRKTLELIDKSEVMIRESLTESERYHLSNLFNNGLILLNNPGLRESTKILLNIILDFVWEKLKSSK